MGQHSHVAGIVSVSVGDPNVARGNIRLWAKDPITPTQANLYRRVARKLYDDVDHLEIIGKAPKMIRIYPRFEASARQLRKLGRKFRDAINEEMKDLSSVEIDSILDEQANGVVVS